MKYYHVTFASRVPAIEKEGLLVGKRRIWSNSFGAKLGKKAIYLFNDPTMAVRWAHKMQYEFNRKTVILIIQNPPGTITADDHIEAQMNGNSWFHTDETIPPECITKVIPLTLELTRSLVKDGSVTLDEEILDEGRDAPLYHYLSGDKALDVFSKDQMAARWEHIIPGVGTFMGNSFTRNQKYKHNTPIRITVNQTKLSQTNKIIPLDGEHVFRHTLRTSELMPGQKITPVTIKDRTINDHPLSEEFVVGTIKNIHRCIEKIEYFFDSLTLTPYNRVYLYEYALEYAKKFNIECIIDPKALKDIEDIKRGWEEIEDEEPNEPFDWVSILRNKVEQSLAADSTLDEAAPTDEMKSRVFYHGVSSTKAAHAIGVEGLKGRETQGKSHLAPVTGKVYLTADITYAIIYALGGVFTHAMQEAAGDFKGGRDDPYGYVFVVKGSDLIDVQPDEDSIGEWVADHAKPISQRWADRVKAGCDFASGTTEYSVWHWLKSQMTENQFVKALDGFYAYYAAGGKRALKKMPDWIKIFLINKGAHIAHGGSIHPSECWRILKQDVSKLKKDGSNFFQVAEKL